jgi:hypothetical protein
MTTKSLTLTIDNSHELEILTGTHAYLEDGTLESCRPWNRRTDEGEGPVLTPETHQELAQIIEEAEALYARAKRVLLNHPADGLASLHQ